MSRSEDAFAPNLPPGPNDSGPLQTLRLLRDPWNYVREVNETYGDVFTLRPSHSPILIVIADPSLLRGIFTGPNTLHAGRANQILEPAYGDQSILFMDGYKHTTRRRLLLPSFRSHELRQHTATIAQRCKRELDSLPLGHPVALHPRFRDIASDVMMHIVLGIIEPNAWGSLKRCLLTINLGESRQQARESLHGIVRDSRLARHTAATSVLSLLLHAEGDDGRELADDDIVDELIALLVAGEATVAGSLAWAVERLSRHMTVQTNLRSMTNQKQHSIYLTAILSEVLRSRPVLHWAMRFLSEPFTLRDWKLPKDAVLAISLYLLHRRADLYPHPDRFLPERFMGERQQDPYTWMPFGGGARRCLGANLALLEIATVLHELLTRFVLLPPSPSDADENWSRNGISHVPEGGAVVRLLPVSF